MKSIVIPVTMKHIISFLILTLSGMWLSAQQIPLSENYYSDRYSLSAAYAGIHNSGYIFTGYRSDWSGVSGGPRTVRLSFSNGLTENTGYGAKVIYDKTGIFRQLYLMGSYSYNLEAAESHFLAFGLSAGVYSNSIRMSDYYNDPNYNIDPALINNDIRSKLKFMSDFSAVYRHEGIEAGLLFTNITFGEAHYDEVKTVYKPLANFQLHAVYGWDIDDSWRLTPLVIIRGGKYIRSQFELAAQLLFAGRFHGSLVFRDPGIIGAGLGAEIAGGLKLGYNFNMATNVQFNAFNSHEVTLGVNISEYLK